jgi:hypothetical protein
MRHLIQSPANKLAVSPDYTVRLPGLKPSLTDHVQLAR